MRTMTVKLEMLSLKPNEVYIATNYPKDGLYTVDDGFMYLLIGVFNGRVNSIPLPSRQVIDEYARIVKDACSHNQNDITKRNIETHKKLTDKIEELDTTMKHVLDKLTGLTGQLSAAGQSNIDLAGLTKMIAVAQKPDLVKGK